MRESPLARLDPPLGELIRRRGCANLPSRYARKLSLAFGMHFLRREVERGSVDAALPRLQQGAIRPLRPGDCTETARPRGRRAQTGGYVAVLRDDACVGRRQRRQPWRGLYALARCAPIGERNWVEEPRRKGRGTKPDGDVQITRAFRSGFQGKGAWGPRRNDSDCRECRGSACCIRRACGLARACLHAARRARREQEGSCARGRRSAPSGWTDRRRRRTVPRVGGRSGNVRPFDPARAVSCGREEEHGL